MKITEALAELKVLPKRIAKNRQFVADYLMRRGDMMDPLAEEGGSPAMIAKKLQSITDLENRIVDLRMAIQKANNETMVEVNGVNRSISQWLIWKREVAQMQKNFYSTLYNGVKAQRDKLMKEGKRVTEDQKEITADVIVVNMSQNDLMLAVDDLEVIEGSLDGILSMKNATVDIEI